jgi:transposase
MTRPYGLRDDQWERIAGLLPGRAGGACRRHGTGQSALHRRGAVPLADGHSLARPARALWALEERAPAVQPLGGQWGVGTGVRRAERRRGQRVCHDRRDHRAGAPAQRGSGQKGGGDEAIGRSKGGLSTKIHALVDALGNPTGFALSAGQASELAGADVLLPHVTAPTLIADKGYDAEERVLAKLHAAGTEAVIPPRRNRRDQRVYDRELYKARHLIENFFGKLKQYRAMATRYDKTQRNFLAALYLAASAILLN